jgi:hypothetical protein
MVDQEDSLDPVEPEENLYANSAVSVINFEGYVTRRKTRKNDFLAEYQV